MLKSRSSLFTPSTSRYLNGSTFTDTPQDRSKMENGSKKPQQPTMIFSPIDIFLGDHSDEVIRSGFDLF